MKSALLARLEAEETAREMQPGEMLCKLKEHAKTRLDEVRGQCERTFADLEIYEQYAAGNFTSRKSGKIEQAEQNIFDKSNASAQMVRSVRKFLLARTSKDALSGEDWFAARVEDLVADSPLNAPANPAIKQMMAQVGAEGIIALAEKIQPHAAMKLRECDWRETGREAIGEALDLGFAILKTSHRIIEDVSEDLRMVLVDAKGQPIVGADGDYFYPEDELASPEEMLPPEQPANVLAFPRPAMQAEAPADTDDQNGVESAQAVELKGPNADDQSAGEAPEAAAAETPAAPTQVFTKDPNQEGPTAANKHQWKECLIENRIRLGAGLDVRLVHRKDAGWPINAARMDLADPACDFIYHSRDASLEELRDTYDPKGDNLEVQEKLEKLKAAGGYSQGPQSEGAKPKAEQNEAEASRTDELNPLFKVTECYFRRKIMEKGGESRVFLCLIENSGSGGGSVGEDCEVMWVEYLAQVCAKASAPLHLVPVNKVSGRAYGIGLYQLFEIASDLVDELINGVLIRNQAHCNPIKAIVKNAIDATAGGDGEVRVNEQNWLLLSQQGLEISKIFQYMSLPDLDTRTWELIEMFMQLIQTESGVTNAAQGDLSNLPSNGTATGVNSLLESSSVLHNFTLEEVRSGLRGPLRYGVLSLYFHQDCDETFDLADPGNPGATKRGVMTLAEAQVISKLRMTVDILLTRAKKQEEKEAAMAAIPLVKDFLMTMPPQVQIKMLPLYVQALRANGIERPETFFPTKEEMQQALVQQQMQAQIAMQQGAAGGEQQTGAAEQPAPEVVPRNVIPEAKYAA